MKNNKKRRMKTAVAFAMALMLGFSSVSYVGVPNMTAYAFTTTKGLVVNGPARVRRAPVDGEHFATFVNGTVITVVDETMGSDGYNWYKVSFSYNNVPFEGYCRADLIELLQEDEVLPNSASTVIELSDAAVAEATGAADATSTETSNAVEGATTDTGATSGETVDTAVDTTTDTTAAVDNSAVALTTETATTQRVGTCTGDNVNVRAGAGTSFSSLAKVNKGHTMTVIGETTSNGALWYNVSLVVSGVAYSGWIHGNYVTVTTITTGVTSEDEAYVAALQAAGFPESYCNSLLQLHKKYPAWQFVPVRTGLNWDDVVANESVVGRNLVQASVNDSRKSTETGAYNWADNTWYGFDGAGWVSASKNFIAYCLDPRNFLDETYIFQFETLEYAAYQNATGVGNILANTFMSGNYTDTDGSVRSYADTFVEVGSGLAVSPYHLAARCKQEQGVKGTSPLISGNYSGFEGYYNFFNVGAYTTSSASSTVNGLTYAKNQQWNSIYKSINGGSAVVANKYVKKGQNTIYFEKFNVVNHENLYSHQYMTNVMAAISEGNNMSKAYTDKSAGFVFRIPVYENMPASAVTFTDTGNPNNWLSALNIAGYNLTPGFSGATTQYSLIVDTSVATIDVSATAVSGKSNITGTGRYNLNYGDNTISVTCISQSGVPRTYTINVARTAPVTAPETPSTPSTPSTDNVITTNYKLGDVITGIAPASDVATVLANISVNNGGSVKILKADGTEQTGAVGTGNKVTVYDASGNVVKQYEVVIYGDINGDGKISNIDVVMMQKQILGLATLSGANSSAANVSKDGNITNKDLVILQKHILNISAIEQ